MNGGWCEAERARGINCSCYKEQRRKKLHKYPFPSIPNGIRRITPKNQTLYWLNLWYLLKQIRNIKSVIPKTPSSGPGIRSLNPVKAQDSINDHTISQCSYKTWINILYIARLVSLNLMNSAQVTSVSSVVLLI
jgi:hypothetical protein